MRALAAILLIALGAAGAAVTLPRAARQLTIPPPAATRSAGRAAARSTARPRRRAAHSTSGHRQAARRAPRAAASIPGARWLLALPAALAAGLLLALAGALARRRQGRCGRWRIHLTLHDQAKAEDLQQMVEALVVGLRATRRTVAIDAVCRQGAARAEWHLCLCCDPRQLRTVEACIATAYPDVWIGRTWGDREPAQEPPPPAPGWVLRLRKRRGWHHPLCPPERRGPGASPPLEAIAQAQLACAHDSVVRLQLRPLGEGAERALRAALARRRAQTLLRRAELEQAIAVHGHALAALEVQIAAADRAQAAQIASALIARRGQNHLHARRMLIRQRLYRQRFSLMRAPLWAAPRQIVSCAEAAFLFQLPSAAAKLAPLKRLCRVRLPAPPQVLAGAREQLPTSLHAPQHNTPGAMDMGQLFC